MEEEEVNLYVDDYPFIGRSEYLEKWENNWETHKIFGIFGMQCVGKSRTVWEFLRQKKKQCEKKRSLQAVHIDLRKVQNLDIIKSRLLAEIVKGVDFPDEYNDDTKWLDMVISAIKENSQTMFAIVMDNAEDIILGELKDKFLTLCQKLVFSRGIVNLKMFIVSTSEFLISMKKRVFFKDEIKPMNEEEGTLLLKEVVKDSVMGLDDHATEIVRLSGSLPSVIIMSGSEMTEDGGLLTPTELIELLMKCRLEILSREFYPEEERTDIVMTKFLSRLSEIFREQMAILSYIPGSFDDQTATGMLDHESPAMAKHKSLIPLRKHHMLEYDQDNRRFNIHGLLKDCLSMMNLVKDYPMVRRRYAKVFYAVFDKLQRKLNSPQYTVALKDLSLEHQNLQKLVTDVEYSDYETFPFFVKMVEIGQDLLETHLRSNCFEFFEKCLQLSYKFADKSQKATVLIGYGRAQTNVKGNYESGQEKLCQAIEVLDDLPCTFATAQAYQSLGFTLQRKGEVEEGLRCLEEALKIETELDIPNNRLTLSTLSSLGIVCVFIGNFEDGKKYHLESLKRRLDIFKTEKHPHIGACYNNMGLLYENMGEYDKALEYYEKGLNVKVETKAPLASRLISVCNVAMQYMRQRNLEKAYNLLIDAENQLKTNLQASTFIESFIKDCLAQVLIQQGKYQEALGVIHSAILIRKIATPNNLTLTESLYHRANAYRGLKNYKSAKTVLNRALKTSDPCIKQMPRTRIMLQCYKLMMDICIDERNSEEAARFYVKSKQELIRILGLYQKYGCPKVEAQLKEQLEKTEQEWNDFSNSPASNGAVGGDEYDDLIEKEKKAAKQKMLDEDIDAIIHHALLPQRRPELRLDTQRTAFTASGQNPSTSTPQSAQSPIFKISYAGTPPVGERRYFPQHRPPLLSSSSSEIIPEEVFEHKGDLEQNKNPTSLSLPSANRINDLSVMSKNLETTITSNNNNMQNNVNLSSTEIGNLNKESSVKEYTNSKKIEISKFGIGKRKNSQDAESKDTNKLNNSPKVNISEHLSTSNSIDENDAYTFSISPKSESDDLVPKTPVGYKDKPSDPDPEETIPKRFINNDQSSFDKSLETKVKEKSQEDVSKIDTINKSLEGSNTGSYCNLESKTLMEGPNMGSLTEGPNIGSYCNSESKTLTEGLNMGSLTEDPNIGSYCNSESKTLTEGSNLQPYFNSELKGNEDPTIKNNLKDENKKPENGDKKDGIFSSLSSKFSKFFSLQEDGNNDDNTGATFSPFSI